MASETSPRPTGLSAHLPKLTPRKRRPAPANPQPVPETPPLPPPPATDNLTFVPPTRRILSAQDHETFLKSPTYDLVLSFVFSLADAVVDTPASAINDADLNAVVKEMLDVLEQVESLIKTYPPDDQEGSRFGNRAFRDFIDGVAQRNQAWHRQLGITDDAAVAEVAVYFLQSFGNRTRIDYGSGHELNFIMWLLCLYQLNLLPPSTFPSLVLRVFARYLTLVRSIQSTYYLEPAGSHGVWGLDDYQFLPFLFGASQLLHHAYIRPLSIHQTLTLEEHGADFLYLGQVASVNAGKNVEGLRWHSPMLDDISAAKSWAKVAAGMRRMFAAEVLGKLPVMQHFLFGALVPAPPGLAAAALDSTGDASAGAGEEGEGGVVMHDGIEHVHGPNAWGDCCGIKVPGSVGAAQESRKRAGGEGLRRVPFD
ncbi:MAG: Serine/threonine-protein phosphatase 2A activator 2 [Thelocarpon impressellum]|nr:MAG: Serine/threonine-protein phosphatase 2A activator 2 [Thelocarpon impressellum]